MPKLSADQRRALEMLAGTADGLTWAMLMAHHFAPGALAALILDGFASVEPQRMMVGGKPIEVQRYRITDLGRRALK